VLAGPAEDLVVARAAVEVVILAVAVEDVRALAAVDGVVARLAEGQVVAAAVGGAAALRVVEELVGARDDLEGAVIVETEAEEGAGADAVGPDQPEDVAVVAKDDVGVAGMARCRGVAVRVPRQRGSRAAEEDVVSDRPLRDLRQAEEVGAVAD